MSQDTNKPSLPSTLYTEEYFLNACEGYEEFVESQGERLSRRLSEAFAYAEVKPGMKVLDVGCGRGEILRHVTKLGARAYGVDYAEVAVKSAAKRPGTSRPRSGCTAPTPSACPIPTPRSIAS